jgi:hypothetical protein
MNGSTEENEKPERHATDAVNGPLPNSGCVRFRGGLIRALACAVMV